MSVWTDPTPVFVTRKDHAHVCVVTHTLHQRLDTFQVIYPKPVGVVEAIIMNGPLFARLATVIFLLFFELLTAHFAKHLIRGVWVLFYGLVIELSTVFVYVNLWGTFDMPFLAFPHLLLSCPFARITPPPPSFSSSSSFPPKVQVFFHPPSNPHAMKWKQ